ncbi:MAG: hypothetical protein ACRC5R_05830 [Mycoplasmatales bacterium]
MKFNKFKIITCYVIIIFSISTYVVSQTLLYSYYSNQEDTKSDISTKKDEYDKMMVKINTINSREKIIAENPNLEIRDNVYYLESYE